MKDFVHVKHREIQMKPESQKFQTSSFVYIFFKFCKLVSIFLKTFKLTPINFHKIVNSAVVFKIYKMTPINFQNFPKKYQIYKIWPKIITIKF